MQTIIVQSFMHRIGSKPANFQILLPLLTDLPMGINKRFFEGEKNFTLGQAQESHAHWTVGKFWIFVCYWCFRQLFFVIKHQFGVCWYKKSFRGTSKCLKSIFEGQNHAHDHIWSYASTNILDMYQLQSLYTAIYIMEREVRVFWYEKSFRNTYINTW